MFEFFIITCILLSCIALAIQTPLSNPHTTFNKVIEVFDGIFTLIFLIEAVLKILALGLLWNQLNHIRAYIWNPWNVLDLTVVIMSILDFFSTSSSNDESRFSGFKALRAIRALRPLRVISRSENLKIIIRALFSSIPAMGHVLLVCALFLLIFAIMGVIFFNGTYYYCQIKDEALLSLVEERYDCYNVGGIWKNRDQNFDNVMIASAVLFSMMTTEGWTTVMANGIDAVGIEKQPEYNRRPYMAIFFVVFMIIGSFFLINLFTAVITDHINKARSSKELGTTTGVSELQKQWAEMQRIGLETVPIKKSKPPQHPFRLKVFRIVTTNWFDYTIIALLALNSAVIAMTYHRMSDSYEHFIEVMNLIFIV